MMNMFKIILYGGIFFVGFALISLWNFYSVIKPQQFKTLLTPSDFNLSFESVTLKAPDGVRLSGWLIASPDTENKKAIIILHGYPAEKSDMLGIAASLYPDFSLLLLDLRSFGDSGGNYTTFGVKERGDTSVAIDFLEARGINDIGIFGFSLGGAVGILTAAEDKRIGAVASYGTFSDLRALGYESYAKLSIFKKPMVELMLLWGRILFGESLGEVSPIRAAGELSVPVFVAHSTGDEQIDFVHAKRLNAALSANKDVRLYVIENKLHGDLSSKFYTELRNFFEQAL